MQANQVLDEWEEGGKDQAFHKARAMTNVWGLNQDDQLRQLSNPTVGFLRDLATLYPAVRTPKSSVTT